MTCLEKLTRANRWRIRSGEAATDDTAGFNGHFLVPLDGELWFVGLSDGLGWRHLSVYNAQKKLIPSWYTMCRLKDAFFGDLDWVVQFHPGKDDYINDHPGCLHLWQPLDEELPRPHLSLQQPAKLRLAAGPPQKENPWHETA
jgi:hypothetical protein